MGKEALAVFVVFFFLEHFILTHRTAYGAVLTYVAFGTSLLHEVYNYGNTQTLRDKRRKRERDRVMCSV